ncbi:MAG: hypothetical protein ABSF94_02525 [Steroidobacteraceae bacterium]|jgi:hypothetical protein
MPFASWSVVTVDFLVVLHLAMGGVTLAALLHLVNAKWRFDIRYISVSFFALFPLAFVLLLILLFNGAKTFPWVGSPADMPGWNNLGFLAAREIVGFCIIGALYGLFIKFQAVSTHSAAQAQMFRNIALLVPFGHVLFCTMVAWDFEMTLTPGWSSAIFAMYHIVSSFGMMLSVLALTLMLLMGKNLLKAPPGEYIFNFLAQLMLAFTILFVYTFFAQYLIIWYANLPDETGRLFQMQNGPFSTLFWLFFILKFVVPFPILVIPFSRHSRAVIAFVAVSIIVGYWIERYTWIAGAASDSPMSMFSPFAILASVVIFGTGFFLVRGAMRKYGLIKIAD